jgi:predicted signal transduction protein with EAL and GGDEF domain
VLVGASLGVSTASACGYDVNSLIEQADKLMYQVKRECKGGYRITYSKPHSDSD